MEALVHYARPTAFAISDDFAQVVTMLERSIVTCMRFSARRLRLVASASLRCGFRLCGSIDSPIKYQQIGLKISRANQPRTPCVPDLVRRSRRPLERPNSPNRGFAVDCPRKVQKIPSEPRKLLGFLLVSGQFLQENNVITVCYWKVSNPAAPASRSYCAS